MKNLEKEKIITQALVEYKQSEDISLTKLAEKYKISRKTLTKRLKDEGYPIINRQNEVRIDETMFDVIDSEEKAYWLGFLYADGNIGSSEYKLEMNLQASDWEHMKKFQEFLKYKKDEVRIRPSYGKGGPVCRFSIRNKHIWAALNEKGCTPRKTLTLCFPDKSLFKDPELLRHFMRGYVDGDGCLGIYPTKTGIDTVLSITGMRKFLEAFAEVLGEKATIYDKKNSKASCLQFGYRKARKIARFLYDDATIYLQRKFDIYKEFCRLEEQSSMMKSSKNGES